MDLNRRQFLRETSIAATLTGLSSLPVSKEQAADPLGVRKDFAATREYTYLNTAYIGIIPRPVVDVGRAWIEARARQPFEVGDMLAKTEEVRTRFARLINATTEEIGILYSTTEGENVVVDALDFKPGDNSVIDDLVYSSTPVIYRKLEEARGVELRMVEHRDGLGIFTRHTRPTRPEAFDHKDGAQGVCSCGEVSTSRPCGRASCHDPLPGPEITLYNYIDT